MYDWLRGLHILADIAWMAGLLYLPRLFVYHTRATPGSETDQLFQVMERNLLRVIMNPAMIVAWLLGLALLWYDATYRLGGWGRLFAQPWIHAKLGGVVLLTAFHMFLAGARRRFAEGRNTRSERFWRRINEVPFLLAIVMVLAVTVEFGAR
jgi:protoporphyrinogen IX oxidase